MISGGCLEAELMKKAKWFTRNGAVVKRYSTETDDDGGMPFGSGCGGTVDLLLEPSRTPEFDALINALERSLQGHAAQIINWLPTVQLPMRRAVLSASGQIIFRSGNLSADEMMSAVKQSSQGTFVDLLRPPPRLVVIGAGEDARPLVSIASLLGWRSQSWIAVQTSLRRFGFRKLKKCSGYEPVTFENSPPRTRTLLF